MGEIERLASHMDRLGLSYAIPIDLGLEAIEKVRRLTTEQIMAIRAGQKPAWWSGR